MLRYLLALSPFVLAVVGCKPESLPPTSEALRVGQPVPVIRLRAEPYSFTYYSGLQETARLVVRDGDRWREVWTAIWRRHSPEPALPAIDFSTEMVIVAAHGERNSGGYSVLIDSAEQDGAGLVVRIRSVSPGPRCGVTGALSQPVDIARLPRTESAVRFEERTEVSNCP